MTNSNYVKEVEYYYSYNKDYNESDYKIKRRPKSKKIKKVQA